MINLFFILKLIFNSIFTKLFISIKKKEHTYNELSDLVKQQGNQNIIVAKIDCTKYTSMASHFGVRGFPTILFIDSNRIVEFIGDRNKDEMFEFVKRLSGPSIRQLNSCDHLEKIKKQHNVFFIEFANEPTSNYTEAANQFHSTDWFYQLNKECSGYDFNSIYCIKPSLRNNAIVKKYDQDKLILSDWIRLERFPKFMRIGLSNLHYLLNSNKILAIVLINESKIGRFKTNKEREYYEVLEELANSYSNNDQFIFGWTNQLDMINSIAIQTIEPIPSYVFINASTVGCYLYNGESETELIKILDSFVQGQPILPVHGGNTYLDRFKRLGYDGFIAITSMFETNPILTIILFGLPLAFFSIILYCSFCSEMLDSRDDDELDDNEEDEEYEGDELNDELIEEEMEEEINEDELDEYESKDNQTKVEHLKSE